jgi:hypothetical protein
MFDETIVVQLTLLIVTGLVWLLAVWVRRRKQEGVTRLLWGLFTLYALGQLAFVLYAWNNRVTFPLNLEAMELLKLQHVKRLLAGQPLYVEPSADFIPLVYNPLYYYLTLPFTWVGGATLSAMRAVSIVGALGAYLVAFLAVRRQTASGWWGLITVGLMAAAFRAMDSYLDTATADSWTLFSILLGCYLLDRTGVRLVNLTGLLWLIAAFWFKQYGALFTIGGVLFVTWRDGWRQTWHYWVVATLLGPVLYLLAPANILGVRFHYYTWQIPRQWAEFSVNGTLVRVVKYVIKFYGVLAFWATVATGWSWLRANKGLSIWYFMLPFALLSGLYVALDPGNNNNVFIPLGACLIIVGVIGLVQLINWLPALDRWGVPAVVLALSFALLFYRPTTVLIPADAPAVYADLRKSIAALDGPVYAPGIGTLQEGDLLYPTVHWVPLIDLIRFPGADLCNQPLTRKLLAPVLHPAGPAYILLEHPLEEDAMLAFLSSAYKLEADFGNRFIALRDSPKLLEMGWPTYLYKYEPVAGVEPTWRCA